MLQELKLSYAMQLGLRFNEFCVPNKQKFLALKRKQKYSNFYIVF